MPGNVELTHQVLGDYPHRCLALETYADLDRLGRFDVIYSHGVMHHLRPPLDRQAMEALVDHMHDRSRVFLMLYTKYYHPDEKFNFEGPYTRGFSEPEMAELLGERLTMLTCRYVLANTSAWVVARPSVNF